MHVNFNKNNQLLWVAIGMSAVAFSILVIMGIGITHKEKALLKKSIPDSMLLVKEIRVKDSLKRELNTTQEYIHFLTKSLDSIKEEMGIKDSLIDILSSLKENKSFLREKKGNLHSGRFPYLPFVPKRNKEVIIPDSLGDTILPQELDTIITKLDHGWSGANDSIKREPYPFQYVNLKYIYNTLIL